jgi:hypothetical protein
MWREVMDETIVRLRDLFQVATKCSAKDAWDAENEFCSNPEAQKVFMASCATGVGMTVYGAYMFQTASGVTIATGGTATPTTAPVAALGAILAGAGGLVVKKFCIDFVKEGVTGVTNNKVHYDALTGN